MMLGATDETFGDLLAWYLPNVVVTVQERGEVAGLPEDVAPQSYRLLPRSAVGNLLERQPWCCHQSKQYSGHRQQESEKSP
jgi:hypothetical protein